MVIQNIVFFGVSEIAHRVSLWGVEEGVNIVLVSNNAQWDKWKAKLGTPNYYQDRGIQCFDIESLGEYELPSEYERNSLLISVGAPWIFRKSDLDRLHTPVLNLHGSKLPKDRGGTLFSWQILNGLRSSVNLLHKMTEGIDQGPVVAFEEYLIPSGCRLPKDYISHYDESNVEFLIDFIKGYSGELKELDQPEYLSSYWPRLRADVHGGINWSWTSLELERFICAFDEPYGGARCSWNGNEIVIRNVRAQSVDGSTHPFQNGMVYRKNNRWINVCCSEGELIIETVLDTDGNSIMDEIKLGDRLYTTQEQLMRANNKVIKTSQGLAIKQPKL